MENYSISKCDCCDKKFTQMEVYRVSEKRAANISSRLKAVLASIGAKGTLELVSVDSLIVGVIYEYQDALDLSRSDQICACIEGVFANADAEIQHNCTPVFIDVA